jgi:cell division protein ZapA (FtsZ GTPase activity inhibitor)
MEPDKAKVVIKLNGKLIPFVVDNADEPYFREANDMLSDRLATLQSDYSAHADTQMLVSVLAVEALVDGLKVNERYQKLRSEVQGRLDIIQDKFND